MRVLIVSTLLISSSFPFLTSDPSNFAVRSFPDPVSMSSECNTFDEAHYCKMITLDTSLNVVAESHKCECAGNYRCPVDTEDTKLQVHCVYDNERQWNRCYLPCTPTSL
ncbi:unnamed protein product [Caenorhabditis sp. 36 PRJEB53466]|nr:unnamed protein product [Caenorhabditis sp. 36 PRJEB53466]